MRVKKENPLRQLPVNSSDYGEIKIHLKEILEERNISLNQLSFRAEMQRTQLNQYCKNEVTRLDTAVLARLCNALGCKISDLLEYVPKEEE